jgi:hypothetical protein
MLALTLLLALPPEAAGSIVSAQPAEIPARVTSAVGGIGWWLKAVGADAYAYADTNRPPPIGKAACDANAEAHFSLNNIPANYKYLEVWLGSSCQMGDRQSRIGAASCALVSVEELDPTITIDTDFTIPLKPMCDLGDGEHTFFVLPVTTQRGPDDVAIYANITLGIDQTPPSAPTDVTIGAGQTENRLSWTAPDDAERFWIISDFRATIEKNSATASDAGNDSETCTSETLQANADFDPHAVAADGVESKYLSKRTSSVQLSKSDSTRTTAADVAVAVIAEDAAGNYSRLSSLACFHREPGAATPVGGGAKGGGGCTALGVAGPNTQPAWPMLLAFGLVRLLAARARSRPQRQYRSRSESRESTSRVQPRTRAG